MISDLTARARAVLRHNDAGDFTKPSLHQYPHQWNWDSAVIALGLSHFDLPRARTEVRSLLRAQWHNGMVPHVVYPQGASEYFPDPDFWQTKGLPYAGTILSSGLTQPPLLSTVVRTLHERSQADSMASLDFIHEIYPQLLAWHRWLHTARDLDGTGLPCLIHPWESGTDNSPRWTSALARITPTDLPPFRRRDTIYVSVDERPLPSDYERFIFLIDVGRRAQWDSRFLLQHSPFLVQDVMFCAILHRADEDLRELALLLDEQPDEIDIWLERTQKVFNTRFWNDERGLYFDYDVRADAPIPVNTCATFAPLFAGLASKLQARRLIEEHWNNPAEYAPNEDSQYRLPTTSKNESGYSPRRYWCGPIWIITNWIFYEGLLRYGFSTEAKTLLQDSLALVQTHGFHEYFDPRNGKGYGATDFSWSAALILEMLSK